MVVIDFHTHVFSDAVATHRKPYLDADPGFRSVYSSPNARIATASQLIEVMDRAGIDRSVICGFGWTALSRCVEGNDAIIEAVQRYPARLIGLGTVSPDSGLEPTIAEIRRIEESGLSGLGELRPDTQGWMNLGDDDVDRIADALRERAMLLLLHASEPIGHSYAGKDGATPEKLSPFLRRLKGVPTILAHAGGGIPFYAYMPEVAEDLADVYVDTAALPYLYRPSVLDGLVAAHGEDRMLFGTDFPLMEPERVLQYIDDSGLSEAQKTKLLGENAEALLARISTHQ